MFYSAELNYMKKVLRKMHLQVTEVRMNDLPDQRIDLGLRNFLNQDDEYESFFQAHVQNMNSNTIYKLTDTLCCRYVFLCLPGEGEQTALFFGPYLTSDLKHEQILEIAECYGVPPQLIRNLENFYSNIPIISDPFPLYNIINAFGELIWGTGEAFEILDVDQESSGETALFSLDDIGQKQRDILLEMQNMETRYAFENELMETVSRGQSQRATLMVQAFSAMAFEQRISDPVRNFKNYCIICNTLLRKAAEQGGVHPIYLDKASSDFAQKIELLSDMESGKCLMEDMIRSYCRLVRKHSMKHYSPPIQKTLAYIDADLSGDLSLRMLASIQGISSSYLSALFKKETGQTITDYVNQKRVQRASHLLKTTKLQIQTIAQHCGISDVNYFSKIFKKYTDMTPKEYRKELQNQVHQKP